MSPRRIDDPIAGGPVPQCGILAGLPFVPGRGIRVLDAHGAQQPDGLVDHGGPGRRPDLGGVLVQEPHVVVGQADTDLHTVDSTVLATALATTAQPSPSPSTCPLVIDCPSNKGGMEFGWLWPDALR